MVETSRVPFRGSYTYTQGEVESAHQQSAVGNVFGQQAQTKCRPFEETLRVIKGRTHKVLRLHLQLLGRFSYPSRQQCQ